VELAARPLGRRSLPLGVPIGVRRASGVQPRRTRGRSLIGDEKLMPLSGRPWNGLASRRQRSLVIAHYQSSWRLLPSGVGTEKCCNQLQRRSCREAELHWPSIRAELLPTRPPLSEI
jgi:hypothetical protein